MANQIVVTPEGRVRWMHLFEAKEDQKGIKKKSVAILIPKKSSLQKLQTAWENAAREEFAGKIPGSLRRLTTGQKPILKDGDEYYNTRDEDKQPLYEAYQGCWVLQPSCLESDPLRILGPDNADVFDPETVYDGCYAQLVINFSVYTAKKGKDFAGGPMCSVSLRGFRKTRDGEPIESQSSAPALTDEDIQNFFGGASTSVDSNESDFDL